MIRIPQGFYKTLLLLPISFLLIQCKEEAPKKSTIDKQVDQLKIERPPMESPENKEVLKDTLPVPPVDPIPLPEPPPPPRPIPTPLPGPEPEPEPWPNPLPEPIPHLVPEPMPEPGEQIIDFPAVEASFPGGDEALMTFVKNNIKYPTIDKELGNQGKVYVSFVVEKDGSLSRIEILKGVSQTIDAEAIRVLKLMPLWNPAEDAKGNAVKSLYRMPLNFRML